MTVPLHDDPLLTEVPVVDGFKVLEPCVLYSKIGEGGMGAVYRGRHLNLDIDVAVKCLRRTLADQGSSFVQRFQREARLAAGIHHQNLVQVYDVSQKGGVHYLVMEFVSGETARDRVRRKGPLQLNEALRIALGAAGGLAEAHARRIVHRDVKPDNVLISREGEVKVSDLGLAKAMESEVEITLSQAVMGTPQYMAPEQWEDSSKVTPAADVWALGATLYFLLAGTDPIKVGTMQQVMRRICLEPFPDIRSARPDVPAEVARLIERCMARSLEERFPDCRALLTELKPLVGRDQGELVSRPGESTQMGATLVSPPPPETLARIRLQIDTRTGSKVHGPAKTEEVARPPSSVSAPKPAMPARTKLAFGLGGGALLVALTLILILRGGTAPVPVAGSHKDPASAAPMSVRFDGIADMGRGYPSSERAFELTGAIEGWNESFEAEIRGQKGDVEVFALGGGRFRYAFRFDRDGEYELELKGERLKGPKTLTLTVDSTAPVLATHETDPKGALERGAKVSLSLQFDETLASAQIDGNVAKVDGRRARVTFRAPEQGQSWEVPWKAVDRAGHEAAGSFTLALETLSLPAASTLAASVPESPPPSVPKARPMPSAPKRCSAASAEALALGGKLWAKRIQHTDSGIYLVLIPPGDFVMGSTVEADKAPAPRTVTIRQAFYMSENEVSEAEFARGRKQPMPGGTGDMPKAGLSWKEANEFCHDNDLELPREAEWEYACRAGSRAAFAFGPELQDKQGSTDANGRKLRPCGFSERNEFALADMHGNLREYCADEYATPEDYAKLSPIDPFFKRGKGRVLRGGSYVSKPALCASAARQLIEDEGKQQPDAGLRVIKRFD